MKWPFENDTNNIVKKLAKKNMKSEKRRNIMVIISVVLSTFLVCLSMDLTTSLIKIQRDKAVDTYEACYTNITEQNVTDLKNLPEFARVGEYYIFGEERDSNGYNASYVYCDKDMIYTARNQLNLVSGEIPLKKNEIAVSNGWLSKYNSNKKIGDFIQLNSKNLKGKYKIVGLVDSLDDEKSSTYSFLISKATLKSLNGYNEKGYRAYVHFKNDTHLNKDTMSTQCKEISEKLNLSMPSMNTNYFKFYENRASFSSLFVISILVLAGGYVVIQSIFRISINDKIQNYGQLRTIGTTSKQVRKMVKKEGHWLASIGILLGVLMASITCYIMLPKGFDPLMYAIAAILSIVVCWIMVSIYIRKPVKIATKVSPIEAVTFSFNSDNTITSRRKNIKLNSISMGVENFKRDKKRMVSIIASLSFGGILLLIISAVFLTRSPEKFVRQYFPNSDYRVYVDSDISEIELFSSGNPLNDNLKKKILSIDGVTDVIEDREAIFARMTSSKTFSGIAGMCDIITDENASEIQDYLIEGKMPTDSNSILVAKLISNRFPEIKVGSKVNLILDEKSITVTVSGLYDHLKVTNGHDKLAIDSTQFFTTKSTINKLFPNVDNYNYFWSVVIDPEKEKSVEKILDNIVAESNNLSLDKFKGRVEYEKMVNEISFGGLQILSWLIFLFGVINLINTTLSNQISRKVENSILRSIGLTEKQLYKMYVTEGLCYLFAATIVTVIVGTPISIVACRKVSTAAFAGRVLPYQFPIFDMGLFVLVLFILEFVLATWSIRKYRQQSLIEQMQSRE